MQRSDSETVRVIDSRKVQRPLPLVQGGGFAYAVLWPDNGACYRTFNVIEMNPGDLTRELSHGAECVYYVERGDGAIDGLDEGDTHDLVEGAMLHIGPGEAYQFRAGQTGMRLIGGTVPVDPALYDLIEEEDVA